MSWESPINVIWDDVKYSFDNEIYKAVQKCHIEVDKGELIKALEYDRGQYEKGYADGKADFEPKRGRWKSAGMGDYMCSLCAEFVSGNRWHYCPNCGAEMREMDEVDL